MTYVSMGAVSQSDRRALAAEVVSLTQKAAARIDYLLANEASLFSVMNRGLIFVPTAYQARQSLIRARKELFEKFRPIALTAIEDPTRNLAEVRSAIFGYLNSLEQQFKITIQISENQTLSKALENTFDKWAKEAKEALDPMKSFLPWVLGGFGSLALLILLKK